MTIRIQIGYELKDLPNAHCFLFRGVEQDGDLVDCVVLQHSDSTYKIYRCSDGIPYSHELRGWMQHLPKGMRND